MNPGRQSAISLMDAVQEEALYIKESNKPLDMKDVRRLAYLVSLLAWQLKTIYQKEEGVDQK